MSETTVDNKKNFLPLSRTRMASVEKHKVPKDNDIGISRIENDQEELEKNKDKIKESEQTRLPSPGF